MSVTCRQEVPRKGFVEWLVIEVAQNNNCRIGSLVLDELDLIFQSGSYGLARQNVFFRDSTTGPVGYEYVKKGAVRNCSEIDSVGDFVVSVAMRAGYGVGIFRSQFCVVVDKSGVEL